MGAHGARQLERIHALSDTVREWQSDAGLVQTPNAAPTLRDDSTK